SAGEQGVQVDRARLVRQRIVRAGSSPVRTALVPEDRHHEESADAEKRAQEHPSPEGTGVGAARGLPGALRAVDELDVGAADQDAVTAGERGLRDFLLVDEDPVAASKVTDD